MVTNGIMYVFVTSIV